MRFRSLCRTFFDYAARFALATLLAALTAGEQPAAPKQPKVTDVICDDVYNQIGKHGNAQYLLDIWPISQGARRDARYRAAKKKLKSRIWAWGIN